MSSSRFAYRISFAVYKGLVSISTWQNPWTIYRIWLALMVLQIFDYLAPPIGEILQCLRGLWTGPFITSLSVRINCAATYQ